MYETNEEKERAIQELDRARSELRNAEAALHRWQARPDPFDLGAGSVLLERVNLAEHRLFRAEIEAYNLTEGRIGR